MSIHFAPKGSIRRTLMISLDGPSNSGKTYSALVLATQIADGGKIAVVDTEAGRASHYEDDFEFDHYCFEPPYTPDAFSQAAEMLEKKDYAVVIWDSASDEYEGIGGVVEMAAAGTAKNDVANWAKPKAAHKGMMARLRTRKCHSIFCLRAEDKIEMIKVDPITKSRLPEDHDGPFKQGIAKLGFQPICEKRFMYDMAIALSFAPGSKGHFTVRKMTERLEPYFQDGQLVGQEHGKALLDWSHGRIAKPEPQPDPIEFIRASDGKSLWLHPAKAADMAEQALNGMINAGKVDLIEKFAADNPWLSELRPDLAEVIPGEVARLKAEVARSEMAGEPA